MHHLRKFVVGGILVAATVGAMLPANAIPPGGSIVASVNGTVNVAGGTCADGRSRSVFNDVTITGAFTRSTQAFVGLAGVTAVPVCLTPIVGGNQLLATGTLEPGAPLPTYASTSGVGSVAGTLTDLTFTNLGVVSIATVDTNFAINGGVNTGNVVAHVVVLAVPAQTIVCEAGLTGPCANPLIRDIVAAAIVA
jgi:hypothetical protein